MSNEREPLENLMLAVLLNLVEDYKAVWTLDKDRILDMRYYGDGTPIRYKRGRPSHQEAVEREAEFNEWLSTNRNTLTRDMKTWGAILADDLGLTTPDNFIKVADQIRENNGTNKKTVGNMGQSPARSKSRKASRVQRPAPSKQVRGKQGGGVSKGKLSGKKKDTSHKPSVIGKVHNIRHRSSDRVVVHEHNGRVRAKPKSRLHRRPSRGK